jgi:hypothetical protein
VGLGEGEILETGLDVAEYGVDVGLPFLGEEGDEGGLTAVCGEEGGDGVRGVVCATHDVWCDSGEP